MSSLYWDDFQRRTIETAGAIKSKTLPPVRRVAVFITDRCNFKCSYCNHNGKETLSEQQFQNICEKYGSTAIIHITGGEPSVVPWLYPFLESEKNKYRFNLNTNAYITPPYNAVRRLKISLDSCYPGEWNKLVGVPGAWNRVVENIKESSKYTIVSVTCVLTRENYIDAPKFALWTKENLPDIYALFFSTYKGNNPKFKFTKNSASTFFSTVLPTLKKQLGSESLNLLEETLDEKIRIMEGIRFPENTTNKLCYLSMSERVISPTGQEYTCSHLYRDKVYSNTFQKHPKCSYGCNRRLVKFNEEVEKLLEE